MEEWTERILGRGKGMYKVTEVKIKRYFHNKYFTIAGIEGMHRGTIEAEAGQGGVSGHKGLCTLYQGAWT